MKSKLKQLKEYFLLCDSLSWGVVAAFLVQRETDCSIRKMIQIFKDKNPKWSEIKVAMTDKDMTERNVIKSEMPQVSLQICLFHVLRTFGREITGEKMGISSGEKSTILRQIQDIAYARNEATYLEKYQELCDITNDKQKVRQYYDSNWHSIREEWVEGLKSKQMNLGTRTNNRVESFFSNLKRSVSHRGTLQEFIERFMGVLKICRNERSHRLLSALTKVPTTQIPQEEQPLSYPLLSVNMVYTLLKTLLSCKRDE